MSNLILYVNNYRVPDGLVSKWPELTEEVSYDSAFNVPDSFTVEVKNTGSKILDWKIPGSVLYGTKLMKIPVAIYDPDLAAFVMRGVLKNPATDSDTKIVSLECTSQLSALAENDVQLVASGITPADIIYKMLTAPLSMGLNDPLVDPSYIDNTSYRFASQYQAYRKCTANITVYRGGSDNKKYADMLPEIGKLGHMCLYTHYDRIYFWQHTETNEPMLTINQVKAGSYKDFILGDDAYKIKNTYIVAYLSGATVEFVTGKDDLSIKDYGSLPFGIPSDDTSTDTAEEMTVAIDNAVGAKWCGETAMSRLSRPSMGCEFQVSYNRYIRIVKIGDVLGLNFGDWTGQNKPAKVLSIQYNKGEKWIKLSCLFM